MIPEEFETSIEIFSMVLHKFNIPRNIITDYIDNIRKDGYGVLRTVDLPHKSLAERHEFLKDIETETYLIKEGSRMKSHSIRELRLRTEIGVTIIAVQRGEETYQNPSPDLVLMAGDIILLIGNKCGINMAMEYFETDNFQAVRHHGQCTTDLNS